MRQGLAISSAGSVRPRPRWADSRGRKALLLLFFSGLLSARISHAAAAKPDLDAVLKELQIRQSWDVDAESAARAAAAGVTEERLLVAIAQVLPPCAHGPAACPKSTSAAPMMHTPRQDVLIALTGELGTERALPMLWRLESFGWLAADAARERLLARAMQRSIAASSCAPPSSVELAAQRISLEDFAVITAQKGVLGARPATENELADLGYFLAVVGDAGPPIGAAPERPEAPEALEAPNSGAVDSPQPGQDTPQRVRSLDQMEQARKKGDLAGLGQAAATYLRSLGDPGTLRRSESPYAWGGARASYVMRDLALASEALGDFAEAARLYRRADPGGGMCGTGESLRRQEQLRGLIRSEERRGRCRAVVAERLLGSDEPNPGLYGTRRLIEAGFDVPRLYRGALLTLHRDADLATLRRVIEASPLGTRGLKRLETRGRQDWERRTLALEGLADTSGRQALGILLSLALEGTPPVRQRASAALGKLAESTRPNPCDPNDTYGGGHGSSEWSRPIRALGQKCATRLSAAESQALSLQLVPLLSDASPEVREETARTLGLIASRAAAPALRKLLDDPYQRAGQTCVSDSPTKKLRCYRAYPVREAAQAALKELRF